MDKIMGYIVSNYVWFLVGFIAIIMIIIGYVADTTDFWHKKVDKNSKNDKKVKTLQEAMNTLKDKKLSDVIDNTKKDVLPPDDLHAPLEPLKTPITQINPMEEDLAAPFGDSVIPPLKNESVISSVETKEDTNLQEDLMQPLNKNIIVPLNEDLANPVADNISTPTVPSTLNVNPINSNEIIESNNSSLPDLNDDIVIPSINNDFNKIDEKIPVAEPEKIESSNLFNDFNFEMPINSDSKEETKEIKTVDYDEPIVPEFITDSVNENSDEEDIWKF